MKFIDIIIAALLTTSVRAGGFYYDRSTIELALGLNLAINVDIINNKCHPLVHNLDVYLCLEPLVGYTAIDPINIHASVDEAVDAKAKVDSGSDPDVKAHVRAEELAGAKAEVDLDQNTDIKSKVKVAELAKSKTKADLEDSTDVNAKVRV